LKKIFNVEVDRNHWPFFSVLSAIAGQRLFYFIFRYTVFVDVLCWPVKRPIRRDLFPIFDLRSLCGLSLASCAATYSVRSDAGRTKCCAGYQRRVVPWCHLGCVALGVAGSREYGIVR
jgi:hypothetical protein